MVPAMPPRTHVGTGAAPLGEGDLDGTVVARPWHGSRHDVTTGAHAGNPALRLAWYLITLEGGVAHVNR